ncbi:hypothetical protein D3C71_1579260 [compost metagenome]
MATAHAAAVVQDTVVDNTAEDSADLGAEGTAAQAAEDDTNHGADASADGTRGHAEGEAGAAATQRACDAAGRASETAQGAAGALGDVSGFDAVRAALRTLNVRQGERSFEASGWK